MKSRTVCLLTVPKDIGWKWTFGICAIFFGIFVFMVVLFVPETAYIRTPIEKRVTGRHSQGSDSEKQGEVIQSEAIASPAQIEQKESYLKSIRFVTGKRYSDAPFWKIIVRPAVIFFYPAVLWGFLIYGVTLTWIVVFSVANAGLFAQAPYNFGPSQVGLLGLSPFIFTIIGEVVGGPLNDWICLHLTKKNHGVYEPEFRLVLMAPVLIIGIVGFFGFGLTLHYKTHWIGPAITFGLANMAMAFESGCVFGYIIDSYEDLSEEGTSPL